MFSLESVQPMTFIWYCDINMFKIIFLKRLCDLSPAVRLNIISRTFYSHFTLPLRIYLSRVSCNQNKHKFSYFEQVNSTQNNFFLSFLALMKQTKQFQKSFGTQSKLDFIFLCFRGFIFLLRKISLGIYMPIHNTENYLYLKIIQYLFFWKHLAYNTGLNVLQNFL